ncbi:hypothetical protein CEXT_486201 [Caerostris extrusa]|uniref:Uncharacterized protein n=1 Tax=Caerostris extrusa TaxID=172846 RepID=A0AAV4N3J0_CAEEX|nr:hypothetical protein CEXT_486201 [Caerostris extrusa]
MLQKKDVLNSYPPMMDPISSYNSVPRGKENMAVLLQRLESLCRQRSLLVRPETFQAPDEAKTDWAANHVFRPATSFTSLIARYNAFSVFSFDTIWDNYQVLLGVFVKNIVEREGFRRKLLLLVKYLLRRLLVKPFN